ncbi:MAG: transglutaminase-like domain-containing protein [Sedimentisphaerales bacterium]|nr:transglutaminase-like domain-containing protein [Sedimentisphaerales bacterium]
MKGKFFLWLCFVLVVFSVVGCRKKPTSSPPQSVQQTTASNQDGTERVSLDKPTTEKLPAKVIASAIDVSEDQEDETEYFALLMEGKKVGYAIQRRDVEGEKVTTSIELKITLSRIGVPVTVKTNAKTFETVEGKPLGFELEQAMGLMASKTVGTIDERGKVKVKTGQQEVEFDWPEGAVMSEGMRLLHLKHGLEGGTAYNVKAFDPSMMQVVDVEVKVGSKQNIDLLGRVVALIEVTSTISLPQTGPMVSTEYYDDELSLQKSVMPVMGMTIEQVACSKEFALGEIDVLEVVNKMFMKSPEPLGDVGSARSITYYLSPVQEAADLRIPSGDNQRVERLNNGNLLLTVEPVAAPKGESFPYSGSDPEALEALKASRYVESDQKVIIDLAKRAVGRSSDAAEAISRIEAFVADYVEDKNLSVGYASAVEVVSSKQGDCTEHAVLTAALCRAVGIPAKVVTGLAYVEEWGTVLNGFGGHAWAQAYVGDKWIGIDAAFRGTGRGGYDAGHIILAAGSGNPEDFLNLIGTMGQFKIDRVEVKKR